MDRNVLLGLILVITCNTVCSVNWKHPYGEKLRFIPEGVKEEFPFQNYTLPWKDRINDLVSRLTLDEVILQISRGGASSNGPAPAIDRLGIKPYNWNTECLRGYGLRGEATCFPQPIGLAATFDDNLIKMMSQAVAKEARAKHNQFNKEGNYGDHTGLSCFAPVINIMRHPLWGRNQETYGEDPVLTSIMSDAYVTGLYGGVAEYPAATAVCKHFDVHGGPENIPTTRFGFNAVVSDHDWGTTFLPAFRACLKAGAEGVMCSYNAINGVPSCANKKLLSRFDFMCWLILIVV
uniref:Probable beta-D-xylosidase 6 n=1 Tax=Phallusia mammillata TaxID=59560 RepID=A0A6F9DAT7_9ASCI|nr:probable beta-D-xylosidase 6 [Phallusia mammillata]